MQTDLSRSGECGTSSRSKHDYPLENPRTSTEFQQVIMRLNLLLSYSLAVLALVQCTTLTLIAHEPPLIQPTFLMDEEPPEKVSPSVVTLNPGLLPLWKKALARPESDLQRQAAMAITRAQRNGHQGLRAFAPDLMLLLRRKEAHPTVRMEAARALIALDHREAASLLVDVSQHDGQLMRLLVEPALAKWNYEPIQSLWLGRLSSPRTHRRELTLAIDGLSSNHVLSAGEPLRTIAASPTQPEDIRLAAARGAGNCLTSGSEHVASELFTDGQAPLINRLCAASLLSLHTSEESITLRQRYAVDPNPTVSAIALRSLYQADPELVLPVAAECLGSPDANVRRIVIETYLRLPTEDRIRDLSGRLNDSHPALRTLVREGYYPLSRRPEFEVLIRELAINILGGEDWRGQEQAALLLAALDRKEIATRLVELLNSPRDEVMIASAWGLKKIAVPTTAEALTQQLGRRSKELSRTRPGIEHQVAHLCEALALFKHVPAIPVLKVYVPKQEQFGPLSRSAAFWALGQILEDAAAGREAPPRELSLTEKAAQALGIKDQPPAEEAESLAASFMKSIEDVNGMPPEANEVRRTAALALGRMRAKSQLAALKKMIGTSVDHEAVDIAMRWAVLRISGEELPISPPLREEETGWFIEPAPVSLDTDPPTP